MLDEHVCNVLHSWVYSSYIYWAVQFCKLYGPVYPTLASHIYLHVPTPCFFWFGLFWTRDKAFVTQVRKSTHATEEFCNLQKQQVLKDTPHHKPLSRWEWGEWRRGRGGVRQWGWPVDKGTSSEGFSGYKVELLELHDWKVRTCCAICIIPCVPRLPCNYSFQ